MSTKVNVFVKIDMSGKGSKAFYLEKSTKISELKQKVADREGAEIDTLVYRAKPCRDEHTLADINFQNNGTFMASIRLIGGAAMKEGNNATQFNKYHVEKLAAKHGASVVTSNCIVNAGTGCEESNILKCKFACGCILCADCFRYNVKNQCGKSGCTYFTCGSSSHANKSPAKIIDRELAYAVCAYDEATINEFDWQLEINYSERPTAYMKACYNCKKFVARKKNDESYTEECPGCHKIMCWSCGEAKHDSPSDCSEVKTIQALIDGNRDSASFVGKKNVNGKECWSRRVCINKECDQVNAHKSNCNHMTCQCNQQYCHWCLQDWKSHNSSLCTVKDKEVVTAKYLWG